MRTSGRNLEHAGSGGWRPTKAEPSAATPSCELSDATEVIASELRANAGPWWSELIGAQAALGPAHTFPKRAWRTCQQSRIQHERQWFPFVVVGRSQQDLSWIGSNADVWLYYFVDAHRTELSAATWRQAVQETCGNVQGLCFNLLEDPNALAAGRNTLIVHLEKLRDVEPWVTAIAA